MTDKPNGTNPYEYWLAERREACPPASLTDEVMNQVEEFESRRQGIWWLGVVERIERQRAARWGVCVGALAVGSLPYLFLAYVPGF